jgi:hypothetical protein
MNYLQNRDRLGAFLLLIFSLFYLRSAFHIPVDPFDAELGFTSKTLPIGLSACATETLQVWQMLFGIIVGSRHWP